MKRSLAEQLYLAAIEHHTMAPPSASGVELPLDEAYAVQEELIGLHERDGARVVGAKLGLTSRAKQVEMGIADPIRGWLTDRMSLAIGEPFEVATLGQPRAEPEIALTMEHDIRGPDATAADVLRAVGSVHAAIEILDSRYLGYKFTLPDVIADNTSGGRFVIGPPVLLSAVPDMGLIGCVFEQDGTIRATAAGAATMGHPARATAWLVRELASTGRGLSAGDTVLTGGLTAVAPLSQGSTVTAAFDRLGSVRIECV